MPPAAMMEMSLIVEVVSVDSACVSACAFCSFAVSALIGLFSLLPGRVAIASSVSFSTDPLIASTVIFPPAVSVTLSSTLATTLECRTATVTPTPTPAVPPTAAVPEMISALITSFADTVMSLTAVILVPAATVAETESLRVFVTSLPFSPVSVIVIGEAVNVERPDSPSAVVSNVAELYD